jgi:hypothetical protein
VSNFCILLLAIAWIPRVGDSKPHLRRLPFGLEIRYSKARSGDNSAGIAPISCRKRGSAKNRHVMFKPWRVC